jgi:hypothetical protein
VPPFWGTLTLPGSAKAAAVAAGSAVATWCSLASQRAGLGVNRISLIVVIVGGVRPGVECRANVAAAILTRRRALRVRRYRQRLPQRRQGRACPGDQSGIAGVCEGGRCDHGSCGSLT